MHDMPRHVKKAQKVPNFRAKKTYGTSENAFFHAMYSPHPKEFKKAIEIKNTKFFSGSSYGAPYLQGFSKN